MENRGASPLAPHWRGLYRADGAAALANVAFISIQLVVFIAWLPPTTAGDFFVLLQRSWLLGRLSLDFL